MACSGGRLEVRAGCDITVGVELVPGAKAPIASGEVMRGFKPPPPSVTDFSVKRETVASAGRWLLAAKGENEGVAGGAGGAVERGVEADAGADEVRAGEDGVLGAVLGRLPAGWLERPLRISSMGNRRWAWISLRRPSSRWKRCSWR